MSDNVMPSEQEQTKTEETNSNLEKTFYPESEYQDDKKENQEDNKEEVTKSNDFQDEKKGDEKEDSKESPDDESSKETSEEKEVLKEFSKDDLELSEESALTVDDLEGIVNFAKEQGLSKEQAQSLVKRESDLFARNAEEFQQRQVEQLEEQESVWMSEMQKDDVFGGDNLKENAELARRALNKFGDDRLVEDIKNARLGNHPGLSRMLMRIGRAMGNDELIKGDKPAAKKSMAEVFYGNTN